MAHFKWKVSGRGYEAANLFDEKLEEKRNSGDTEIGDDISSIKQVEKMEKRNEAIWYSCAPTRRLSGSIRFTDSPSDMDKQTSEKNNVSLPVMMTLFIAGEDLLRLLEKIDADRKCDISCAFSELNSNQNIVYRINKITKLRILAQDSLTYEFGIDSENSSIDKYRNKTAEVHFRLKSYKAFRCNSIDEREQLLYGLDEKNGIRYNIETYK